MTPLDEMFANPYWHALRTEQASLAIGSSHAIGSEAALRFPADVIPFAGMNAPDAAGVIAVRELLSPGESIYVTGEKLAAVEGIEVVSELPGVQMHFEGACGESPGPTAIALRELHASDAPAMVGLTDVAFPGFFRPRTYVLGKYFGIEIDGMLVAMAGERLALPGYREISAVCTHPEHTGRGYAAILIRHLLRSFEASGLRGFLHTGQANHRAISLYERLGFVKTRPMLFHQLRRS